MCKKRRIKRSFGMGEKKQLRVKNGTIVVEDRTADIKVKKNYSISQDAVEKLDEITKKLGNTTASATVEEIINTLYNLIKENEK